MSSLELPFRISIFDKGKGEIIYKRDSVPLKLPFIAFSLEEGG